MIEFEKVSPWFMWLVGYLQGFAYFLIFKPNNWIWQFVVFICVVYMACHIGWRLWYSRLREGFLTMLAPDKGQAAVVKDNQAIAPCG